MGNDSGTIVIESNEIQISNPDKLLFKNPGIRKADMLAYYIKASNEMLPFLKGRPVTLIRYPDGIDAHSFYQKHLPGHAPGFIKKPFAEKENIEDIPIVCDDLSTMLWLVNLAAVEFHVPFQRLGESNPREIVLDLDPPSRRDFSLAVEAALIVRDLSERLGLDSYVKTSGNKGLQVYFPLPDCSITYRDTKKFLDFTASYLIEQEPDWFTVERLKKKRGRKLYLDVVQHAEGKTIIAPYSLRGNEEGLCATPLFWEEVTKGLDPEMYTMDEALRRLEAKQPFAGFFDEKNERIKEIIKAL
ncbi:non-homologous end-joining DNA ligase [Bacillus marinisedimentorum]|uniref:non-homologous end-joining DNA ligase n=1 Tax=Bacillus marinisedimentorum TaxID=1821260 RepID=UPI000A866541|nr:non-homologous end-joining DNA ligase [Bacillus marinisedimentorum]